MGSRQGHAGTTFILHPMYGGRISGACANGEILPLAAMLCVGAQATDALRPEHAEEDSEAR